MIFPQIAKILAEIIEVDHEEITPETEFTIDYGVEPIDVAKLIIECEKNFKIIIHDEDVHSFKCVRNIAEYIDKILSEDHSDFPAYSDQEREAWYYE